MSMPSTYTCNIFFPLISKLAKKDRLKMMLDLAFAPTRARQRNSTVLKSPKWSISEDELLTKLVAESRGVSWNELTHHFKGKTTQQILERWAKVLDPKLTKGSWTRHEDETIINFVREHGTKSWTKLACLLPGRIGKQCRERWINHLDPGISHDPWTPEEDELLIQLHKIYGNKWVKISTFMPRRSDNNIKNRWNSSISKKARLYATGNTNEPNIKESCFPVPPVGDISSDSLVATTPPSLPGIHTCLVPSFTPHIDLYAYHSPTWRMVKTREVIDTSGNAGDL